jgi:hypothetical protein
MWWEGSKIEHYIVFKNDNPLETNKAAEKLEEQCNPLINANTKNRDLSSLDSQTFDCQPLNKIK